MTPVGTPPEDWAQVLQRTNRWLAVAVATFATILLGGLVWLLTCSVGTWHT